MREIKFRAWHNKNKEMLDWFCICQSVFNRRDTALMYDVFTTPSFADDCGFSLMQYTGLKDKNAKEIYEGDIVSFGRKSKYNVVFENAAYYLFHFEGLKDWDDTSYRWGLLSRAMELSADFDIEVIGNTYDNPELLG